MSNAVSWRWTAVPLQFFGLHGSIAVFFPLLIVTGLSRYTFILLAIYGAYLAFCNARRMSPLQMVKFWRVKFIEGGRWPAF